MKDKILHIIIGISFIIMVTDIIIFYQTPIGRLIMIFAGIVCIVSYLLSDLFEMLKEED